MKLNCKCMIKARLHLMMKRFLKKEKLEHVLISVQFSCSVVSYLLWPHGLQHAWLPCPSPTPGAYSNYAQRCLDRSQECSWERRFTVGGQTEALRPWQRSWGRRLDIRKGGIELQESPWKSSSIYPHNQSLPTLLLCALTYTSDFTGGCPPPPLSEKELT